MKKLRHAANANCPCGSALTYSACCGPFHQSVHDGLLDGIHASTPEALMRSRYSAYVLRLPDYLLATWHGATAPGELEMPPVKWLGLEVRHAAMEGDVGVVEFVARCRNAFTGQAERMHELSRFVREPSGEAGRWYYMDGQEPGEA